MVGLTFAAGPEKSIAIIGPQAQAIAAVVKARGHILVSYDYVTIARSEDAGFVGRLYAAGALLVLDADQAGGCSGLPPKRAGGQDVAAYSVIASEAKQSSLAATKLDCFVAPLLAMTAGRLLTRPYFW